MLIKKDSRRGPFQGMVLFPNPLIKQKRKRILVIAEDDIADSAWQAGADIVGGKELLLQLGEGNIKFDVCLASESMYDSLKPLQQILKNKMPHPRRGTVTNDLASAIKRVLQEQEYRVDKEGTLNTVVGRVSSIGQFTL
jgi:large subunit ribosomal protein L1